VKINQNAKIRFQIILISVLGGLGFFCYLIFSIYTSSTVEKNNLQVHNIQYPILKRLVELEHDTIGVRDSLADVVSIGNELFIEDTDQLALHFHESIEYISKTDPTIAEDFLTISEDFSAYYTEARLLTLALVNNPDDLTQFEKRALRSNQKFSQLHTRIGYMLELQQKELGIALQHTTESIQQTTRIGIYLGTFTIISLFIVTWIVSLKVFHLINQSDKLKRDFLSTMSHELRTPMNGIVGSIELLKSTNLSEEQLGYMDAAMQSSSAMRMSIDDILTFSDFMSAKPRIREEYFDLYAELRPLLEEISAQSAKKSLIFNADFDKITQYSIKSDEAKVQHVIRHLLVNAVKFTQKGKISLEITHAVEIRSTNMGRVTITVTDSGKGVPEEKIDDIFKPFQQLDGSFQRLHQGIGLGLAMCKTIADCMLGSITFKNKKNQSGAIVCFTFPVEFRKNTEEQISNRDHEPITHSNAVILVAEDNSVNQLVIKGLLKRLGYTVVLADNGRDALDKLSDHDISLVLMDCQMPVMDGFESTRSIRNLSKPYCDVPIIAVTANTMEGDKERCLQAGMDEYLKKPVDAKALQTAIESHLRH